ncbi:MBL fold metallo-hydrolase [Tepidimonas taiwanensis]|uniref:Ribonuclease n=1 Tax=Tepidimonas taiwanensis TaxID=307486 RepID=A0A554X8H8_9BURK|nr:MBL fold metallo-hydrolase [Tepidimonas taiwanensis]MCX7693497.1 MBL fold metallo-hydrolase [Tepidimonas taiwanensis]MDM7463247.1 MBL fold metallo-hydrolase [Tepidimonas taiwanensis]TSE32134.1 Ribonuclease [Tepidimonas taiwanensis]UBQ06068.1 MBL fold metallo-hydrolase [Tepidimonas taiwanensis]
MDVRIQFLGGAGTVTGSKYLVQHGSDALLVDCGLFQGYKTLRLRNRAPLPVVPGQVRAVVLTHAHIDHSGYLPVLVREGFRGKVWCTHATRDLCEILLPDAAHLQEEDAAFANRHGFSKHSPALPLYTAEDAARALRHLRAQPLYQPFEPIPGWRVQFFGAGHILGAASVLIEVGGRRLLFSGDLGRADDPLMFPPDPPPGADVVVVESTYGNRRHPDGHLIDEIAPLLARVAARGGTAVVPVFAVGRAQAILHAIDELKRQQRLPRSLPVYLDSPMAIHATALLAHHLGEHRLSAAQVQHMTRGVQAASTPDESKAIARHHGPKVILAGSGMATGGRVLHHLKLYLGDHRHMVILTGYQTPGTRGDALARGAPTVRIHGQDWAVAAEVAQLTTASAHADADGLLTWLRAIPGEPRRIFVTHGEPDAADALRCRIERELRRTALVPEYGATWAV